MPRTKKVNTAETEIASSPNQQGITTESKKARSTAPKRPITLVVDAARSSTKFIVIDDHGRVIECPKLPSVFAELENPLHQELGAYTLGMKQGADDGDKPKEEVKHYVVGDRALLEEKPVAMTDSHDNKLNYFYLLALGAISAIPDLYELSTGTSERARKLTLRMCVLSLADGKALLDQLQNCKWLKINGVKYSLTFQMKDSLYFAEGYGSAVWAKSDSKTAGHSDITVFDIGYGTAAQTTYLCSGKLPLKRTVQMNGGGGLGSLVEFLAKAIAMGDSSRLIPISEIRQILEDSRLEGNKIIAKANDGRDVSSHMERAISWWMSESTLKFALDDVSLKARRHPIVLVGGSFAIPPIKERIKKRLVEGGANEQNIIEAPDPGMLSIKGMQALFVPQKSHLEVVNGNKENQLHSTDGVIKAIADQSKPDRDNSDLLDTQSA